MSCYVCPSAIGLIPACFSFYAVVILLFVILSLRALIINQCVCVVSGEVSTDENCLVMDALF